MPKEVKKRFTWTFDLCKKEAKKYNMLSVFKKNSRGAYNRARLNDWLNDICSHMLNKPFKVIKWTKKMCREEALKYETRSQYRYNSSNSYNRARVMGWLNEICRHMKVVGNNHNRCIYAYEFEDNHVYVGLTYDIESRDKQHRKGSRSSVYRHIESSKTYPKLIKLTDYLPVKEAIDKESFFVNYYKENNWIVLNKSKTGSIGGHNLKITKEKCREEALKYENMRDFIKNNRSYFQYACSHKWLDEICVHMKRLVKPNGYWTFERCREESLNYKTRTSFARNSGRAYNVSLNNGWLDIFYGPK